MTVQKSAVEALSTTTKIAATDAEWLVDHASKTVIYILVCILSLKTKQTTALKAFVEKKDVFFVAQCCVPRFVSLIG